MFPSFAQDNGTNMSFGNTEPLPDFSLGHALHSQRTNLDNLRCCELRRSAQFAKQDRVVMSPLSHHVGVILSICPKPKVMGIYATTVSNVSRRVVHVALVKNLQAVWDRAKVKFPGNAMGQFIAAAAVFTYDTVAGLVDCRSPQPTFIYRAWNNMTPEADSKRDAFSMPMKEAARLPLNDSESLVVKGSNGGLLPTSAMAVTVGDFVLRHKNTSCRMTEHALAEGAGRRQEARNNYSFVQRFRQLAITLSTCKYTIVGAFQQRLSSLQGV